MRNPEEIGRTFASMCNRKIYCPVFKKEIQWKNCKDTEFKLCDKETCYRQFEIFKYEMLNWIELAILSGKGVKPEIAQFLTTLGSEYLEKIFLIRVEFALHIFFDVIVRRFFEKKSKMSLFQFLHKETIFCDIHYVSFIKNIAIYASLRFKKELEAYQKRFKEDIRDTIERAVTDNDTAAINKLVQWDKVWITMDFVKSIIQRKQEEYDKLFFERLSNAFNKKSPWLTKAYGKESRILWLSYIYITLYGDDKDQLRDFFSRLDKADKEYAAIGRLETKHDTKPLSDFGYFLKFLRRHHLIT